jgi:hypothetical protein
MAVESGTTLSELQETWPIESDFLFEGNDHIQIIKAILKAQFPGEFGSGFSKAINATEDEINYLQGVTSNIQAQLDAITSNDNLIAPAGTVMMFVSSTPPVGWTQQVTADDHMLRHVGGGAGGGTGGTDSPISWDSSHVHSTTGHALIESELPAHRHQNIVNQNEGTVGVQVNESVIYQAGGDRDYRLEFSATEPLYGRTSLTGGGAAHDHGDTGTGGSTFTPKYLNVISAVKD